MAPGQADPAERRGAGTVALRKAKVALEKLRDNQSELNDINECAVFVCGFRLGARIMLEILGGSDKWGESEE